ncbi:IS1182 family transposase [Mesorhizobium sp. M7A.F.Ca.CA.001.07.2.1]|uniref:IS1182 family transposase n=1 Tax=Mesorhizobium TaxID=68287 RepID=UPI000FCBB151|nr:MULTISPECIES: IS1182 family transposase [Mesorhizobium]RVB43584.1 IS1182 family transposase [Mesorhizobium sp. M7A.F.Ca.CA.004.05.1.1]MCF6127993.1 IS1182 family transposase [Mesorhizobium ciceri]MCQ8818583.1 IS1182 family transposase [Mesorhizobium sp. SEMIA396]RUX64503.1 IS1182 family transposase [Mesorhizobium sp. M7A.F.Ca.CA.004.08.2.1]RUX79895.1 IS1182 family transposase [Mesorhizobium sp. M7A.F.Ca.CA.004.08.1.1]
MLKRPAPEQTALEMVTLDQLVPADHLLRKIDRVIDFTFVHDLTAPLYCPDNGRPPLDPTLMFKALFIGYLFGVRSERQLVREIEVNVAYRWFLRLKLTDKVFDASTLSQNRRRRYDDTSVSQAIFDRIVEQAIRAGLVDGTVLYTDSTHLKANANKGKYDLAMIAKSRADYWADLDRAIDTERALHGQKPLKQKERRPAVKETKVSRTDPDSGYMVREGKPKGFFYLDHRTVDAAHAIITDTHTTAIVHDSTVYLSRLDRQVQRFGFDVGAVGLDAGYATAGIAKGLEDRAIRGVTGYRRPRPPKPGMMGPSSFTHEPAADGYRCLQGQMLAYATTDRNGYRHYKSDPAICRDCPLLASCTSNAKAQRTIIRHAWADAKERTDANRLTAWGKAIYRRRKETVERSFADAKQLHGHRYARFRSLTKVACQCLIAAAAQNIKKIALCLCPKPKPARA